MFLFNVGEVDTSHWYFTRNYENFHEHLQLQS